MKPAFTEIPTSYKKYNVDKKLNQGNYYTGKLFLILNVHQTQLIPGFQTFNYDL